MQSHIRLLAIPDGRRRLETYLQREAESTGGMVCANMTRERMAQYLGMNRSALSRLLGTMQQAGSIELCRGGIRLLRRILSDPAYLGLRKVRWLRHGYIHRKTFMRGTE